MASATATKLDILRGGDYRFDWERGMYVNRKARKALSIDFVKDHDADQLQEAVKEDTGGQEWRFYTNSPPSESVRQQLLSYFG